MKKEEQFPTTVDSENSEMIVASQSTGKGLFSGFSIFFWMIIIFFIFGAIFPFFTLSKEEKRYEE